MPEIKNRILLSLPESQIQYLHDTVEELNKDKDWLARECKAQDVIKGLITFAKRNNLQFTTGNSKYVTVSMAKK